MAINKVIVNGSSVLDLSNDTATAENVKKGFTFHDKSGEIKTGTMEISGATEPYIEEVYDSDGNLIDATLHGYTKIRAYLFEDCKYLLSVTLPNAITYIGTRAFVDCRKLALTSLPNAITYIGTGAFSGCTALPLTSLPESVTYIGSNAFSSCSNLALTSLPESVTHIGPNAFSSCSNLALTSLPSGVTIIENSAFINCSKLALTELPSGLTTINNYAFQNCPKLALTSIPSSVTSIYSFAFRDCSSLTTITFEGQPTSISSVAFYGCTNLTVINVPWAEGAVSDAPWSATNATINYNYGSKSLSISGGDYLEDSITDSDGNTHTLYYTSTNGLDAVINTTGYSTITVHILGTNELAAETGNYSQAALEFSKTDNNGEYGYSYMYDLDNPRAYTEPDNYQLFTFDMSDGTLTLTSTIMEALSEDTRIFFYVEEQTI